MLSKESSEKKILHNNPSLSKLIGWILKTMATCCANHLPYLVFVSRKKICVICLKLKNLIQKYVTFIFKIKSIELEKEEEELYLF